MDNIIQFKLSDIFISNKVLYISLHLVTPITHAASKLFRRNAILKQALNYIEEHSVTLYSYIGLITLIRQAHPVEVIGTLSEENWASILEVYNGDENEAKSWIEQFIGYSKNA